MLIRWPALFLIVLMIIGSYFVGTPWLDWHGFVEVALFASVIMFMANGKGAFQFFTKPNNGNLEILRTNGLALLAAGFLLLLRNAFTFASSIQADIAMKDLAPPLTIFIHDIFICFLLYLVFFFRGLSHADK